MDPKHTKEKIVDSYIDIMESHNEFIRQYEKKREALRKIGTRKMSQYSSKDEMIEDFIQTAIEALEVDE